MTRVRTPAGDVVWLVSRYEEARTLFADKRLGRSHPKPEEAARVSDAGVMAGPSGDHEHEDADHTSMRRLLTPAFSAKRMRRLHDRVAELAEGLVDDLVAAHDAGTDPVDLHAGFSVPLPIFVICELLGVPVEDRVYFKGLSERMATLTGDDPAVARAEFERYTAQLAEAKRAEPGEDVISDLVAAQAHDPRLTDARLAELTVGLLFAGHETTVNRLSLGVVLLLVNPEVRDRLVADPEGSVDAVVEEVLRLAEPGGMGLLRYAHEDVDGRRGRRGGHHRDRRRRRHRHQRRQPRRERLRRRRRVRPGPEPEPAPVVRARAALLHRREPGPHRAAGGPRDDLHPAARAAPRRRSPTPSPCTPSASPAGSTSCPSPGEVPCGHVSTSECSGTPKCSRARQRTPTAPTVGSRGSRRRRGA